MTFALLLATPSFGEGEQHNNDAVIKSDAGSISAIEFPKIYEGYIPDGITLPTQTLVRSNRGSSSFRTIIFARQTLTKIQVTASRPSNRLYDVSAPFYCTPPCQYYVFALRRLII